MSRFLFVAIAALSLSSAAACRRDKPTSRKASPPAPSGASRLGTAPTVGSRLGTAPTVGSRLVTAPTLWNTPADVRAACAKHLKEAKRLRTRVGAGAAPHTMANTLRPFNRLLLQLDRLLPMAELISNVHPDGKVRKAAEGCERRGKKFVTALNLDRKVYDALRGVAAAGLDRRTGRFRSHYLRQYRRAGVDKDAATRKRLTKLQARMVKLGQAFSRNIRDDVKKLFFTPKELAGLPADFLKTRRRGNLIRVTTAYPDLFPVLNYARSDATRGKLYRSFLSRAYPANAKVLKDLLIARHTYATLLGYPDWAQYQAEDKMVKRKEVIRDFITKVSRLARPATDREVADILARKRTDLPTAKKVRWRDRFYYVKKIQAERYGVDAQKVRTYLSFPAIKKGIISLTEKLFGLKFARVSNAPTWHAEVEAYDVSDGDGPIGRAYLDLHPRKGKYGHAAVFQIYAGLTGVQLPSAALVANFPNPGKGLALMEHNQVKTFLHEFGHLIHHLLSGKHQWVTQAGITCEWDFVEAPSQLLEEWTWNPKVLARFARHHKTGEPIPADLVRQMERADNFGKGLQVSSQMYYAALALTLHAKDHRKTDLLKHMIGLERRYSPYPHPEGSAFFANFGHLNGYSSMYYTYMWSKVLAKDLFTRFRREGLMNRKTSLAYRRTVLEPGGALDAADMVKNFLGRPWSFAAYQRWLEKK